MTRRRPTASSSVLTRRDFLAAASLSATALACAPALLGAQADGGSAVPWYRRAFRWGQTNLNEMDPARYDSQWWRKHWRRTHVQGIVVNAGGIVAFYPSKYPLHYRAEHLDGRDLYGEIIRAAHEDGIAVLARMDSNRTREDFYKAHPSWFALDENGNPYRADDRYITCIDSPYYEEYLPGVLREIIEREKPEGFTDNSWSGLGRNQICYCDHSRRSFRQATGADLPKKADWDDPVYRKWIKWSYARRLEIWDLNNRTTKAAGGPDCLWLGMLGGDFVSQGQRLRDIKAISERSEMIMLDDQGRRSSIGFLGNAEIGKRLHGVLGWDKIIPESMATYQRSPTFRKAAASKPESTMWMLSGFAGGINPWWHHVGAYQWDRRQFQTAIPVYDWYEANQRYLTNRRPVASVGVVYSQENADFYGRDNAEDLVGLPYYGVIQALVRARIPYLPVHADHIDRDGADLSLLVLPDLAAMSGGQAAAVRHFVQRGGGLVASGETSLRDEWGDRREDFALADLLGVHFTGKTQGPAESATRTRGRGEFPAGAGIQHTYLRLLPSLGKEIDGPLAGDEPADSGERHPVLRGFEETDIIAFGGLLQEVRRDKDTVVPATFIPEFPIYPPETSWMRVPRTDTPALVLSERKGGARCAYLAGDVDRLFARHYLPDHGDLLANVVRWAGSDRIPLRVEGNGLVDCHLYRQDGRLILHLVNQTSAGTWRVPLHELIPIGPLEISVKLPQGIEASRLRFLVSADTKSLARQEGWATFQVNSVLDHEVAVIE